MQPMRLRELVPARQAGRCPDKAVVITFDDGYADNLYRAKPLLDQHRIPATVFVATGYTEKRQPFWWDELADLCFRPEKLPETLHLTINGKKERWAPGEAVVGNPSNQICTREGQPGTRLYFYHSLWETLQGLTVEERENALNQIAAWSGFRPDPHPETRPMTSTELIEIASGGRIEIGAHTVNHAALTAHPAKIQAAEIAQSKTYLEQLLGHPVLSFSYPFGLHDRKTASRVRKTGFICACTTEEATVWKGTGRFRLPRFNVPDWDGATFEKKLLSWLQNE
jgi:peptidoglycan/xylan/chitin deacetylase (PgdA/CDA1 family)